MWAYCSHVVDDVVIVVRVSSLGTQYTSDSCITLTENATLFTTYNLLHSIICCIHQLYPALFRTRRDNKRSSPASDENKSQAIKKTGNKNDTDLRAIIHEASYAPTCLNFSRLFITVFKNWPPIIQPCMQRSWTLEFVFLNSTHTCGHWWLILPILTWKSTFVT